MIIRTTIGAFVISQDTADAIESLRTDGHLFRSTFEIQLGGVDAAASHLSDQRTPALLIVETHAGGDELFAQLDQLAGVCDPNARVILIGAQNDIGLYRELMSMGLSDYLLGPVNAGMIKDSIIRTFEGRGGESGGRVITFFGLSGGVGSSVVAHNVAAELSKRFDAQVIIIDADIPFGTAGLNFNLQPRQTIADALAQFNRLDPRLMEQLLVEYDDKLSLLLSPGTPSNETRVTTETINGLMRAIRPMADFIILDLPRTWDSWVIDLLASTDELVLVGKPDLANLRNGKSMVEFLGPKRGTDSPTRLVLNQVGEVKKNEIEGGDFKSALAIEASVAIPFDGDTFGKALNAGELVVESNSKNKAAIAIRQLAAVVSGRVETDKKKAGLLSGLFRKKKEK